MIIKINYKGVFQKLVRERFDIIKELTDEINHDILTFHFKGNTDSKRFDDFNNVQNFLKKHNLVKCSQKKQEKLQNLFKTNLNGKSRGRYKSEEQKVTLGNIKLLYESRQAPIKLFIDYSPTITEAKYKTIC